MNPDDEVQTSVPGPEFEELNVNPGLRAENIIDADGNPTGGAVVGVGVLVSWQNGPRGQEGTDELLPPNGAFVEDMLWAAYQRLQFFQDGKYQCEENAEAMTHIKAAMGALKERQVKRSERGVEGKHEV